jgi:hypothetical protein
VTDRGRLDAIGAVRLEKHATRAALGRAGFHDQALSEHEYERRGALCYLAAWDVKHASLFDRCASADGIVPFDALADRVLVLQVAYMRVRLM